MASSGSTQFISGFAIVALAGITACGSFISPMDPRDLLQPSFRTELLEKPEMAVPGSAIDKVRVHVFPHYRGAVPQGGEPTTAEVTLKSTGTCHEYPATINPLDAVDKSKPLREASSLAFKASSLSSPSLVECDKPATLVREGNLVSYRYSGSFHVSAGKDESGKPAVNIINVVPVDEYVKGVVPVEVPSDWPAESLRAQAVAARTYAYFQVLAARAAHPDQSYDLLDTVIDQAYLGLSGEMASTDRAVEDTAGQIISYRGKVAKAFFHADSGGHTEDAVNVFGIDAPYCLGKSEVYDLNLVPGSQWTVRLSPASLSQKLISHGLLGSKQSLRDLKVADEDRFPSGRARQVEVVPGAKLPAPAPIPGGYFQSALGMRSSLFAIRKQSAQPSPTPSGPAPAPLETYVITGKGFGHGVGMNQWGAKILALQGWDYLRILRFYYTGVDVCTYAPDPDPASGVRSCI